ncbi:MAG: alpha/beta hydrolase [Candidatus Pseudobacter hemicellulosilyticus]|uniref:Alpha/beta hydrolase n=1 Tax=Candidatus Pseudobacter hemicellulosilyticus TaxID=3121375 RepID=A0AAJ5WUA7_9BACT|nr:MAG: alpha/beta hydrolase [Pseudobacter sp.]
MQSANLIFRHSTIHYSYGGNGQELLLCLHGYGESAHTFHFLQPHLQDRYQLVAIDLPFHGHTVWNEQAPLTVADLFILIEAIFKELGHAGKPFTLLGFSMGGRIALGLTEYAPATVKKLVLLAPDGLKVNFWYWLATQTRIGSRLFYYTMKHPGWFFSIMTLAHRFGWVNPSALKFARHYIQDQDRRMELYQRWMAFRKIRPQLGRIKSLVRQHQLPVRLLYGGFDRIIVSSRGALFRKHIEEHCSITIIKAGHQVLQDKYAAEIIGLL